MENVEKKNRILVCIDGSYFCYYALFGAVGQYSKTCALEYNSIIKPAEETDQDNLPDLTRYPAFIKILKNFVIKRCEVVDWILKTNFQDMLDSVDGVDFIFAEDDKLSHSFRKEIYPQYKSQRAVTKKAFNAYAIIEYIKNIMFPDLDLDGRFGYKQVKIEGAEGDDVIAVAIKNLDYMQKIIIGSDHDLLQLDDCRQFDLKGTEITRKFVPSSKSPEIILSPKEFLLQKILIGDGSDNIPQVGPRLGPKKAYRLLSDKGSLKGYLAESQDIARQFFINKKIISFDSIPTYLQTNILEKLHSVLASNESQESQEDIDLTDFMNL